MSAPGARRRFVHDRGAGVRELSSPPFPMQRPCRGVRCKHNLTAAFSPEGTCERGAAAWERLPCGAAFFDGVVRACARQGARARRCSGEDRGAGRLHDGADWALPARARRWPALMCPHPRASACEDQDAVTGVHPRARGERLPVSDLLAMPGGSSPRARGTGERAAPALPLHRFIPACAGNGGEHSQSATRATVHPRVRGERPTSCAPAFLHLGSSPRARGTDLRKPPRLHRGRFIPTCAGNGDVTESDHDAPPVHPRVRGERLAPSIIDLQRLGSSPRARGTGKHHLASSVDIRFIPACAGNGKR